jgi:hypothetical protein
MSSSEPPADAIATPERPEGLLARFRAGGDRSPARVLAEVLAEIAIVILAMIATRRQYGQSVSLNELGHFALYACVAVAIFLPGFKFFFGWLLTGSRNAAD